MTFPWFYFSWLQKDNPTGEVEKYPELTRSGETSVKGIYCIGDLTQVPLINLAAESGVRLIKKLTNESSFIDAKMQNTSNDIFDVIIIGAGPSGVSAALEAQKSSLNFKLLEASRPFQTIHNFPAQKPIHIKAISHPESDLPFDSQTKEELLVELESILPKHNLPIETNSSVQNITKEKNYFLTTTQNNTYKSLRVIIAIGKSGNPRKLNVKGESLSKVFSRLIDPTEYKNKNILVVGGGDSALEAAIALSSKNTVTICYRGTSFSRPKQANIDTIYSLEKNHKIKLLFNTTVDTIFDNSVSLKTGDDTHTVDNDIVFSLIGTQIPIQFFETSKINIEGTKGTYDYLALISMLFFACLLYFGKSASATPITSIEQFFSIPIQ